MIKGWLVLGIAIWCGCPTIRAEGLPGEPEPPPAFSQEDRAKLEHDKVLIVDRSAPHMSDFYDGTGPFFITSDSILNAWNVLLEESVRTLEDRFAVDLPLALDRSLASLSDEVPDDVNPESYRAALLRARIVLGTASRLGGGKWKGNPEVEQVIESETKLVEAAESGLTLPAWLRKGGTDIEGMDYSVFRPTGFYTRRKRSQCYFRAVRWLQTIPFEMNRDEQVVAASLVYDALVSSGTVMEIGQVYHSLIGVGAHLDPYYVEQLWMDAGTRVPDKWRRCIEERKDQKNLPTSRTIFVALAGRLLLEEELFRSTTNEGRRFPRPIELAAVMGSPVAVAALKDEPRTLARIEATQAEFTEGSTGHGDYLRCLASLFAEPEAEAPDFMRKNPWQRKSLNTVMAGWVQIRHSWALQAEQPGIVFGMVDRQEAGFVEPNPAFFRKLGQVSSRFAVALDVNQGLGWDAKAVSRRAAAFQVELNAVQVELERREALGGVSEKERDDLFKDLREDINFFYEIRSTAAKGEEIGSEWSASRNRKSLRRLWWKMADACAELESIAQNQLRGKELTSEEVAFILSYHRLLDEWSFARTTKDDASRVAVVFSQPGEGVLMAGVGRPRLIKVLYPWKGKEIECMGGVMPYLEMRSPRPVPDEEWRSILKGRSHPPAPDWIKPVISERGFNAND